MRRFSHHQRHHHHHHSGTTATSQAAASSKLIRNSHPVTAAATTSHNNNISTKNHYGGNSLQTVSSLHHVARGTLAPASQLSKRALVASAAVDVAHRAASSVISASSSSLRSGQAALTSPLAQFLNQNGAKLEKSRLSEGAKDILRLDCSMRKIQSSMENQLMRMKHHSNSNQRFCSRVTPASNSRSSSSHNLSQSDSHQFISHTSKQQLLFSTHLFNHLQSWNQFLQKGYFEFRRLKNLFTSGKHQQMESLIRKFEERIAEERLHFQFLHESYVQMRRILSEKVQLQAIHVERELNSWDTWKRLSASAAPWILGGITTLLVSIGGIYAQSILAALGMSSVAAMSKSQIVLGAGLLSSFTSHKLSEKSSQLVNGVFDEHIEKLEWERHQELQQLEEYVNSALERMEAKEMMLNHLGEGFKAIQDALKQCGSMRQDLEVKQEGEKSIRSSSRDDDTSFGQGYVSSTVQYVMSSWRKLRDTCEDFEDELRKDLILRGSG